MRGRTAGQPSTNGQAAVGHPVRYQDCSIMTATAEAKSGTSDNKTFQLLTGTAKL